MSSNDDQSSSTRVLARRDLKQLFDALSQNGFRVVGPTEKDGAIVYAPVDGPDDLPAGRGDEQRGGHYRLTDRGDGALFGYTLAPQSWKRDLHPPHVKLFSSDKTEDGLTVTPAADDYAATAFLGVRPCEAKAIAIQDKVFDNGDFADTLYNERRDNSLLVAVNCTHASETCFCVSMGGDPKAACGVDIVLTELTEEMTGGEHRFLAVPGSDLGRKILEDAKAGPASADDVDAGEVAIQAARDAQTKVMPTGHADLLARNLEHPQWDKVAERCLNCANCTMVCPTCFCTTVEDVTSLDGTHAERWRTWDSCFSVEFSYIHGGAIRPSGAARYRQWITHKLTSWHEQFGTSGCVGCGRCITWCPVGIDITEETAAIAADDRGAQAPEQVEG